MDIVIRNAALRRKSGRWEIGIKDGKIAGIGRRIGGRPRKAIDARGGLVTESFVNAHLHLCKVYTLLKISEKALADYHGGGMGKAMTAIEEAAEAKADYNASWILPNVRRALKSAVRFGNTHIRAFADVDNKAKLEGIKALLQAKKEFRGVIDLQIVAFPQDGVAREPGAFELVREAMRMGADVVGGIPWIEYTEADERDHIDKMFQIAREFDAPISMLVDDAGDPGLRTLEMLALATIREGWEGRVLAHHARAMCLYPDPYFMKLVALLKRARLGVISDPHTGPLHARVQDLRAEGALVALGQDDISDAYYPFGRNNMLEVAFLNAHLLWMTTAEAMEELYDMVTVDVARCMGLKGFGLKKGAVANLVVLHEGTVLEALRNHGEPAAVVSHGRLVETKKYR
ncbi:MAG TPA: amidohydrolase family protein [bacterium]|nr:amidohydrolase family protein [bacterium]HPJ71422.1 amidohydrolase family protein [bacterium]HPQ65348.1 amidohydrolase family protein [bacterium]